MNSFRLPRFRRVSDEIRVMELTPRDAEIVRVVSQHRFLRSDQIAMLAGGSAQQVSRRLQLLFHHGYLDRPRSQLDYFHRGGSKSIIYGLGNNGAKLLAGNGAVNRRWDWNDRNQSAKRLHLHHTLLVSEVMVLLDQACAWNEKMRLIREGELATKLRLRDPFRWAVNVRSHRIGLRPDKVFGLENTESGETTYYFLEADQGSMPVSRHGLDRSSIQRKLLAYEATWKQNIHRSRFDFHRVRVLTVTTNCDRMGHLVDACRRVTQAHGLFLFCDVDSMRAQPDLLALTWQSPNGSAARLLG